MVRLDLDAKNEKKIVCEKMFENQHQEGTRTFRNVGMLQHAESVASSCLSHVELCELR